MPADPKKKEYPEYEKSPLSSLITEINKLNKPSKDSKILMSLNKVLETVDKIMRKHFTKGKVPGLMDLPSIIRDLTIIDGLVKEMNKEIESIFIELFKNQNSELMKQYNIEPIKEKYNRYCSAPGRTSKEKTKYLMDLLKKHPEMLVNVISASSQNENDGKILMGIFSIVNKTIMDEANLSMGNLMSFLNFDAMAKMPRMDKDKVKGIQDRYSQDRQSYLESLKLSVNDESVKAQESSWDDEDDTPILTPTAPLAITPNNQVKPDPLLVELTQDPLIASEIRVPPLSEAALTEEASFDASSASASPSEARSSVVDIETPRQKISALMESSRQLEVEKIEADEKTAHLKQSLPLLHRQKMGFESDLEKMESQLTEMAKTIADTQPVFPFVGLERQFNENKEQLKATLDQWDQALTYTSKKDGRLKTLKTPLEEKTLHELLPDSLFKSSSLDPADQQKDKMRSFLGMLGITDKTTFNTTEKTSFTKWDKYIASQHSLFSFAPSEETRVALHAQLRASLEEARQNIKTMEDNESKMIREKENVDRLGQSLTDKKNELLSTNQTIQQQEGQLSDLQQKSASLSLSLETQAAEIKALNDSLQETTQGFEEATPPQNEDEKAPLPEKETNPSVVSDDLNNRSESPNDRLIKSIGQYSSGSSEAARSFDAEKLSALSKKALYDGIDEYKGNHAKLVNDYLRKNNAAITTDKSEDPQFFRKAFIQYLTKIPSSTGASCNKSDDVKQNQPEKATIKIQAFLNKEGAALYKAALEEERQSFEFMNAVFRQSSTKIPGEKWKERPVIFIGGPSGCGKSYAAQVAIKKTMELLPKEDGEMTNNTIVAVDGGVAREVSQMRKLVIQAANNKGYTGISDLHNNSKALSDVKEKIQNAAFIEPSLGVVIPETFSGSLGLAAGMGSPLLKDVIALKNTKPVFCRVDGQDPSLFQKVVAHMGSRRAWKTSGFSPDEPLNLNKSDLSESKAYGKNGFQPGKILSELAEKWFKKNNNKGDLRLKIINDLVLKKPSPTDPNQWVNATRGEKGAILVTDRAFQAWKKSDKTMGLKEYSAKNPSPTLIVTSAEFDLSVARELLRKEIVELEQKNEKITDPIKKDQGKEKLNSLKFIFEKTDLESIKKNGIGSVQERVQTASEQHQKEGFFKRFDAFSDTTKALKDIGESLTKISNENPVLSEKKDNVKSTAEITHQYKDKVSELRSSAEGKNQSNPSLMTAPTNTLENKPEPTNNKPV